MKTTIDIADDLIDRARLIQKRDSVTLRALVEEGLRLVLDRQAAVKPYTFQPVVVGEPYRAGMPRIDVNALIAEGYAEREAKASRAKPAASARTRAHAVAEKSATYDAPKRRKRT